MKKRSIFLVAATAILLLTCCTQERVATLNVIPRPQSMQLLDKSFVFDENSRLVIQAPQETEELLTAYITSIPSTLLPARGDADSNILLLQQCDKVDGVTSPEGYAIYVDAKGVRVNAIASAGLFYGLQTVLQSVENEGSVPHGTIVDEPRFAYRGTMLDVSRHFFDKEFVKKQIDALARYKINRLHLHLTDAAGWRLEIKRYPRLTQLGAWRDNPVWKVWWNSGRKYVEEGSENAHGGYYTQNDIREIVEYAAQRHITIIPEIEMPAHSEEVLTAYPELSCTHEPYKQADFCVGNEKTFEFLENVLAEVFELFPSEYIHIGGDEAGKASWVNCPLCQKRMKEEGLNSVDELQSYLIHRIERFANSKGRQIIGWDEILDGGLAPNATVMSWRGTEGGIKAVEAGHKTVMSPGTYCYLDQYQDAPNTQPEAIGGYLPLKKVYSYNPVPDTLEVEKSALIYGVQGNLWSEYIPTPEHMETMMYPRILAIAEVGWSRPEIKCYEDFHSRALTAVDYLKRNGYSPFDISSEVGNRPEAEAAIKHLAVGKTVTYAQPYFSGYAAGGDTALVDGHRGAWNNNDGAWQGFIKGGVDVTIDLGESMPVTSISADFMQICNPEIFMPAQVIIYISENGLDFVELANINHTIVRDNLLTFKNYGWQGDAVGRYIRYVARRGEYGGWLFTDEIVVN